MRTLLGTMALCFILVNAQAQDHNWWQKNVNWDGVSHWSSYITSSAGMLGPNGLPVPTLTSGKSDSVSFAKLGVVGHYKVGDQTRNITTQLSMNLVKERLSLSLYMVPVEWFSLSHNLKEERKIFYQHYDKSSAIGDLYVDTNMQFLRQNEHKLDAALRIGLKTATSNNQGAARFTNAPGYYFDVSVGKSFGIAGSGLRQRLQGMLGFYAWQTNKDWQQQDDAILYGIAYQLILQKLVLEQSVSGYWGYLNNGDRPVIYKADLSKQFGALKGAVFYWHSLHDYNYTSFGTTVSYTFTKEALLR